MSFTPKKHYPHLDILKGFAIICVVIGHVVLFDLYTPLGLNVLDNLAFRWVSSFHMPLFFLVSGFLSYRVSFSSLSEVAKYWKAKASQLLLPLLCIPILYAITFSVSPRTMLLGSYHGGFWFTWSLFLAFTLFSLNLYLYIRFSRKKTQKRRALWLLVPLLLFKGLNVPLRNLSGELYSAISWELLIWLYPYFLTGYFLSYYELLKKRWISRPIVVVIFCVSFYTFYMFSDLFPVAWRYNTDTYSSLSHYPAVISFIYVLWYGSIKLNSSFPKVGSILAQLGKISLPIYFVHYFFLTNHYLPILDWFKENRLPDEIYSLMALPLTVIVLGVSVLVIRLISRFPRIYKVCFGRLPEPNK